MVRNTPRTNTYRQRHCGTVAQTYIGQPGAKYNEICAVVGDVKQSSAHSEGKVRPVAFGLCSVRLYGTASCAQMSYCLLRFVVRKYRGPSVKRIPVIRTSGNTDLR
jgi:hypothetical protein